jgi:hypothetical protein
MRGAYGKPYGLAARVTINQVMFSIRTTLKGEEAACEALRKVLPIFGNPLVPRLLSMFGAGSVSLAADVRGLSITLK